MFYNAAHRRLTVWIAMLAILFSALAPALSQALEAGDGRQISAGWVEICTAAGSKLVQFSDDQLSGDQLSGDKLRADRLGGDQPGSQPQPSDTLAHHLKNCPYCAAHAGGPALPPPPTVGFAILGGHDVFPDLFYTAPSVQFAWSPAAPRGPPAFV